ncbi:MAG TPA: YceD family protein [Burkholderiales bacterium]|nr:YceD family protein [Burkholderiales bacterium]
MSHQPAHQPVIDGFEFASAGATQQGVWPLSEFPRLRDVLAAGAGEVAYEISGVRDERGRPGLRLKVRGTLRLRCQRCLEPMPFEVQTDETLVLAATLAEIHAEPADAHAPDRVVAGKEMALRDLIEDELILAVPYAPRHESCSAASARDDAEKVSPFAGLRGLMRQKH